jgi:hypothetical protein
MVRGEGRKLIKCLWRGQKHVGKKRRILYMVPNPRREIACCLGRGSWGWKREEWVDLRTPRGRVHRTLSAVKIPWDVDTLTSVSALRKKRKKKVEV